MDQKEIDKFLKISIFEILDTKFSKSRKKRDFQFIKFNNEIRWVIENDNSSIKILKEWRPYSYWNFLFWRIFIFLRILKLTNILLFSNKKILNVSEDFLNFNKYFNFEYISLAFYIGKTNHPNRKSIIFLINKKSKECLYIIKRALTKKAWESLQNEYFVLKKLESEKNKFAPKPLFLDIPNKSFFQEYLQGDPLSINLNNEHYIFLASLINKDKFVNLTKIKSKIYSCYEKNFDIFYKKGIINDLEKALSLSIWDKQIPSVRIHGDFTPWNLRFNKNKKKFYVFDWEYSIESFLPFYDLIFYKLSVKKFLNKNVRISKKDYLIALNEKGCNLKGEFVDELCFISKVYFLIKSKL